MRPPVNMEVKREIGSRIKQIRKDAGLTQQAFAESLSVSRIHINNIENLNHKMMPSASLMQKICDLYNLNYDWLSKGTGNIYKDKIFDNNEVEISRELIDQTMGYFNLRTANIFNESFSDKNITDAFKFYEAAMNLVLEITTDISICTHRSNLNTENVKIYMDRFERLIKG